MHSEHVHRGLDLLEAATTPPPTRGRFARSVDAMDAVAFDYDGRTRASSAARLDYAFWNSLLAAPVGWSAGIVAFGALAALLIWLYAYRGPSRGRCPLEWPRRDGFRINETLTRG